MQFKFKNQLIAVAALIVSAPIVEANNYTYEFTAPYNSTSNVSTIGTAAVISMTFDNIQTSNDNQRYTYGDIKSIELTTVGGTLDVLYSPSSSYKWYASNPAITLLTTDKNGQGTFNFYPA